MACGARERRADDARLVEDGHLGGVVREARVEAVRLASLGESVERYIVQGLLDVRPHTHHARHVPAQPRWAQGQGLRWAAGPGLGSGPGLGWGQGSSRGRSKGSASASAVGTDAPLAVAVEQSAHAATELQQPRDDLVDGGVARRADEHMLRRRVCARAAQLDVAVRLVGTCEGRRTWRRRGAANHRESAHRRAQPRRLPR